MLLTPPLVIALCSSAERLDAIVRDDVICATDACVSDLQLLCILCVVRTQLVHMSPCISLELSHFALRSVQHAGQFNQYGSTTRLPKDVLGTADSIVVTGLLRQRGADAREGLTLKFCTEKQLKVCFVPVQCLYQCISMC